MSAEEEWRPVFGFPDYFVSDRGRVLSQRRKNPVVLRPYINPRGYLTVSLAIDDTRLTRFVHVLVAEAFHEPRPDGLEVRHLDGDPTNNRPGNLRWGTRSENMRDRIRHGNNPQRNQTECAGGHLFTEQNTYVHQGHRRCRICRSAADRRYKIRRAMQAAGVAVAA